MHDDEELSPGFGDEAWEEEEPDVDEWSDEGAEKDWIEDTGDGD